jgi:hypothetical protein
MTILLRILALVTGFAALAACETPEISAQDPTNAQTAEISSCPQLVEPGPHFCQDGTVVVRNDSRGCPYWACDRGQDHVDAAVPAPATCPIPVYPGEQYCQDGTIVVVKDANGCPYYDCQR